MTLASVTKKAFDPLLLTAVAIGLVVTFAIPSSASAAFTRPFVRQISGTPTGVGGAFIGFEAPGGIAVDASDDLWIAEGSGKLDEFDVSGKFVTNFSLAFPSPELQSDSTLPDSLAILQAEKDFYVTGETNRKASNPYLEIFDQAGNFASSSRVSNAHVAVDNSTALLEDPSACVAAVCTVYLSHGDRNPEVKFGGDGLAQGIEKINSSGEHVTFSGVASYIEGTEIVGTPGQSFQKSATPNPKAVTIDPSGNIYAVDVQYEFNVPAVVEYKASGIFVQAFRGSETPGIGGRHEEAGFGGVIRGIAVDPTSRHLLVAVSNSSIDEGVIDEFDVASGEFLNQITETTAGGLLDSAFEMTVDSVGDVYVVDGLAKIVDAFGRGHFLPSLKIADATKREPTEAVLEGAVDPEGLPLSECYFEYVAESEFKAGASDPYEAGGKASCEPHAGEIPVVSEYRPVRAALTGLTPGITYRYRLVATTSGSLGGSTGSGALAFTTPHAPSIGTTKAVDVSSNFAELHALIDPLGASTSYVFEYVDDVHYAPAASNPYFAGNTAPADNAYVDIGSGAPTGGVETSVLQSIGGLKSGTTYHFRVVAKNEMGVTAGPDNTFSTLPEAISGLPDNRAYELVTPPNKGSAEDMFAAPETERNSFFNNDVGYPSESGERFLLYTRAAFGTFAASGGNAYVFSRTGSGWQTISLASPALGVQSLFPSAFVPFDFSKVGLDVSVGSAGSVAGAHEVSLIGPPGGVYSQAFSQDEGAAEVRMAGASRDLSHVIFESKDHALAEEATSQDQGTNALYEWNRGAFQLVNVDSEGSLLNRCGAVLGQGEFAGAGHNAVTPTASRIIFTAPDPYAREHGVGCWNGASGNAPQQNAPQIYTRSGETTVEVSAPEAGVTVPASEVHPAVYVGAAEEGTRIFFVTATELTKDAVSLKLHDPELYEYNVNTGELFRVSAGEVGSPAAEPGSSGGHVFTVPAISRDGSVVYFTAFGRLTATAPPVSGKELHLYRYDAEAGSLTYIVNVTERDYPNSKAGSPYGPGDGLQSELALDPEASWYTSPSGRYLLFASESELTGYDTTEAAPGDCPQPERKGEPQSGRCSEIYLYDAVGGKLSCVSCEPSGTRPGSNAFFGQSAGGAAPSGGPVRAMSDDGSYIFFDSADALVSSDGNGTLDVYEWHNGRLALISSGEDSAPTYFLGSSSRTGDSGDNVFFGTHARLVPQDTDTAGDLYDARVCSQSDPCVKPPSPPTVACEGDACLSPPAPPIDAAPVSLSFTGAGNLKSGASLSPRVATQQKLQKALKACRRLHGHRRHQCEVRAHRRYKVLVKKSARARHSQTGKRSVK